MTPNSPPAYRKKTTIEEDHKTEPRGKDGDRVDVPPGGPSGRRCGWCADALAASATVCPRCTGTPGVIAGRHMGITTQPKTVA